MSPPSPVHRSAILTLAETAARARPDAAAPRVTLANALKAAGHSREALESLARSVDSFPEDDPLRAAYGSALADAGRSDAALEQARRGGERLWALRLEFKLSLREQRRDRLEPLAPRLAATDPANPDLLDWYAECWRERPERRLEAAGAALAHDPCAMHALYHRALALAQLGRDAAACAVMAVDRFVRIGRLGTDGIEGSEAAFRATLEAEIRANPTLHPDPAGHATRHGLRTGTFPLPGDAAGPTLVAAIRAAVEDYAAALAPGHPFVAARPPEARFKAWALHFQGPGRQALHHHPGPWLTGVYYVTAPRGGGGAGALRIGGVPDWLCRGPPWPVLEVEPEPGRLVLFPSFVPHETVPTGSDEARISVAFDVSRAEP